jgi:3-oxosteroid 1-dehydrogenase
MIEKSRDLPAIWDEEADLVVVGSGAAALTAAIVAAVEGTSVIVLEKAAVIGGTTSVSGGGAWVPMNRHMAEHGITDSRGEALAYMRACAGAQGIDEHIVALVDNGAPMIEFLEDRAGLSFRPWPAVGGTLDYRPWLPGWKPGARTLDAGKFATADLGEWAARLRLGLQSEWKMDKLDYYAERMHVKPPSPSTPQRMAEPGTDVALPAFVSSGTALVGQLLRAALQQDVSIFVDAPGKELLVDEGRVVGVRAERDGDPFYVRARRGVHLGTGGYAVNEELKRLWMTRPLEETCDVESNTGDGHLMGLAVGAGVAGLGDAWWMPQMAGGQNPDGTILFAGSREDRGVPHTVIVNRLGKRFMNEAVNYYDAGESFGTKEGASARNYPAWWICDQQARDKYMLIAAKFPGGKVPQWMVEANTISELADELQISADALEATIERFNAFARAGVDQDFQRGDSEWDIRWGDPEHEPNPSLGPIERPQFYALQMRPGALATRGGLRVDATGRVLSALPPHEPIAGLYAAGNCSDGGVAGAYAGAGATIGHAMTFGYMVGKRVASAVDTPTAKSV